jgi:DNA invertase Pin-like site-specific DNA recombinase
MTPAGIYLRVSTDQQNTEVQLPALERMAAARGYEVAQIYRDAAIGGTKGKLERPELARVFTDASRGRIRAVFVWALDRFSRDDSFIGGVLMIGELDHYRCALISHEETALDSSGPFREPLVVLSLKMAASERARLIRRTNEGIAYARAHGTKSGKAIGRPRVELSGAMLDRALELRHRKDVRESHRLGTPRSWRYVATLLYGEGFTVPTKRGVGKVKHQTLQRLAEAQQKEREHGNEVVGGPSSGVCGGQRRGSGLVRAETPRAPEPTPPGGAGVQALGGMEWPKPTRPVVRGAGHQTGGIA